MQKIDLNNYDKDLITLFKDFYHDYMPLAILEGSMGEIWVDDLENPQAGILTIPEFKIFFLGGDAQNPVIREYLKDLPGFSMLMLASQGWPAALREIHGGKLAVLARYSFSSDSLDAVYLKTLLDKLSPAYRIKKIDLSLAEKIMAEKNEITEEQLFGFQDAADFMQRGLGYAVFSDDEMVGVAAAGVACKKGIEVQINIKKKHHGRGLGTATAAALIIDCLENDIDPNWDAATEISAGLAEKLGYTPRGEYPMYAYLKSKFLIHLRTFLKKIRGKEIIEP